nr:hypothetical protein Itr_chr14CG04400 [Ipomoea trifida]
MASLRACSPSVAEPARVSSEFKQRSISVKPNPAVLLFQLSRLTSLSELWSTRNKVNFILLLVDSTSKYDNPTCRMKVSGRRSRSVVRTESSRS